MIIIFVCVEFQLQKNKQTTKKKKQENSATFLLFSVDKATFLWHKQCKQLVQIVSISICISIVQYLLCIYFWSVWHVSFSFLAKSKKSFWEVVLRFFLLCRCEKKTMIRLIVITSSRCLFQSLLRFYKTTCAFLLATKNLFHFSSIFIRPSLLHSLAFYIS